MKNLFPRLKNIDIESIRSSSFVDPGMLEKEMMKYNGGIDLSSFRPEDIDTEKYLKYVPYFVNEKKRDLSQIIDLVEKNKTLREPCSMSIRSFDELSDYISLIYQVSHYNYILGKKNRNTGVFDNFPAYCCCVSSKNIQLSLIGFGVFSTVFSYVEYPKKEGELEKERHGVNITPFYIEDKKQHIAVVSDPTYDQYYENDIRIPMFIKYGLNLTHNITPDREIELNNIMSLDLIAKGGCMPKSDKFYKDAKEYMKMAYSNPVVFKNMIKFKDNSNIII